MDTFPIAVAIIFAVVTLTVFPPSFTFTKIIKVEDQTQAHKINPLDPELTEEELKKLYKDAPPNLDDLVEGINEILFNIEGED